MQLNIDQIYQEGFKAHKNGNLKEAQNNYLNILKIMPDHSEANHNMGLIAISLKKLELSEEYFKRAIKNNLNKPKYWYNLSISYKAQKKFDKALECLFHLIKIDKNYFKAYNLIGVLYNEQGKLDLAIEYFEKGLSLNKDVEIYFNLGNVYNSKKNTSKSIKYYKKALEINPNHLKTLNNLGNTFSEINNLDEAIKCFKRAIKIFPDDNYIKINLSNVYRKKEDFLNAKKILKKLNDRDSVAQYFECLYILSDTKSFIKEIKEIKLKDKYNIRLASISAFASHQLKIKNHYPFCETPLKMIYKTNLNKHFKNQKAFISNVIKEIDNIPSMLNKKNTNTVSGYQSVGDLFSNPSNNLKTLNEIINLEIRKYKNKFSKFNCQLIDAWPEHYKVGSWFVRYFKSGHQKPHIHPFGWISGVVYLKTISNPINKEGAINFSIHGYDYPILNKKIPSLLIQPNDGEIVLFPSSLFHSTIPINKNEERIVIAFDMMPLVDNI